MAFKEKYEKASMHEFDGNFDWKINMHIESLTELVDLALH